MRAVSNRRLFFALWPGAQCRSQLAKTQHTLELRGDKARYVATGNLHMTLHFIGNVAEAELPCLRRQAARVSAAGFELVIDNSGFFKKPRVAWLGCQHIPAGLAALHQQLGARLQHCGFQAEKHHYNPHVTVIRKQSASHSRAAFDPIHWPVADFVLIDSVSVRGGVRYDVLNRFPLQ